MNRVLTCANGFVLNLSIENQRIELRQYGYNIVSKMWDQINQDYIGLETDIFLFDSPKPIIKQKDAIVFSGLANGSIKKIICLVFDTNSQKFNFDIQLSFQLSELFNETGTDVYIRVFGKKFFFFFICSQNSVYILKILHNFNSGLESLVYPIDTEFTFNHARVLNWTSLETDNDESLDYFNFKLLITIYFESKNKIFLKNYLIEPFGGILCLHSEKFLAEYAQFVSRDISLVEETQDTLSLNKNYSKIPLRVLSLCPAEFQIHQNKSTVFLKGKCFLHILLNDQTFIIGLNNGKRFLAKKCSQYISSINFIAIDERQYLILNNERNFYQVLSMPDLKMVFESTETLSILIDHFLEDSMYFLVINSTNNDFLLKKSFDISQNYELSIGSDVTHDFSMDLSNSINQIQQNDSNYVSDLVKVLEYKDKMTDILKEDLVRQLRQKLSLIVDISNIINQNNTLSLPLPKLVDLFTKDFKKSDIAHSQICSIELYDQWNCILNQKLLVNFVIKTSYDLNNLVISVSIKNTSLQYTTVGHECKQFSMKLDSNLIQVLQNGEINGDIFLLNNQSDPKSNICLLTLELGKELVGKLVEKFEFEARVLINYNNETNAYQKYFPIKVNLTDNLVINKNNFSNQIYLSLLNYYENSFLNSVVKLKIYGIGEDYFTNLVTEQLNFEKIFNFESKSIFYLNKQSLITDCFLITSFPNDHLKLTVYTG